jgi:hypothetical protein
MKEKEPAKKVKKSSETGGWLGSLLILILLIMGGFLLFLHFSSPDTKAFRMDEKDGVIEIDGLTREETDKIY